MAKPDSVDPQTYTLKQFQPKYKKGPSASFASHSQKDNIVKYNFYSSRLYKDLPIEEKIKVTPGPGEYISMDLPQNRLINTSSQSHKQLPSLKIKTKDPSFIPNLRAGPGKIMLN